MNTTLFPYDDIVNKLLPPNYPYSVFCFRTVVYSMLISLSF